MPRGNVELPDRFEKAQNDLHQVTQQFLKDRNMEAVKEMLEVQDSLDAVRAKYAADGATS